MSNISKHLKSDVKAKKNTKIGIAVSQYNPEITNTLLKSCTDELIQREVLEKNIEIIKVPGGFEIPYACMKMAETKKFAAIIALGAVIKGETPHFDYIAFATSQGIMDVSLMHKVPVIFGVLTTENLRQAKDRIKGGKKGDKGIEAALTALKIINLKFN